MINCFRSKEAKTNLEFVNLGEKRNNYAIKTEFTWSLSSIYGSEKIINYPLTYESHTIFKKCAGNKILSLPLRKHFLSVLKTQIMYPIVIKRIYNDPSEKDGYRILVDRLWPRGISKETARLDEWNKDLAPSTDLRKWFDHREDRFAEFTKRYESELDLKKELLKKLRTLAETQPLTLLYSAKDEKLNQAIIIRNYLISKP